MGKPDRLLEVQYSGNKAVFTYDPLDQRVDKGEAYNQGSKNVNVRLLQSVTTYVNSPNTAALGASASAVAVKTVHLSYDNGPFTQRARVTKLQECAGNAASTRCLPATGFAYASGGNDAYVSSAAFNQAALTMLNAAGTYGVIVGDFNGDGKMDFVRWSDNPLENQLWTSNGDGTFSQTPAGTGAGKFNITDQNLFKGDGCYISMVGDFNGDGLPDILRYANGVSPSGTACASPGSPILYLNNGDGSFTAKGISGVGLYRRQSAEQFNCLSYFGSGACAEYGSQVGWTNGQTFYLMDVDGDGKLDIVSAFLPSQAPMASPSDPCATVVCTQVFKGDGQGGFAEIATNLIHQTTYAPPDSGYVVGSPSHVVDIDGDRLADLNNVGNPWTGTPPSWRSLGNGNFVAIANQFSCTYPIDFNGDGHADCVGPTSAASTNYLLVSTGGSASQLVANFNLHAAGQELAGVVGIVVADVNADGRQDIIRWGNDPTKNAVYLSNGDGSFTASSTFVLGPSGVNYPLQNTDGTSAFFVGDFTGHGGAELLRMQTVGGVPSNQLFIKQDPTSPDLLQSVTAGTGAKTTLTYVPLSNPMPPAGSANLGARYVSDRGTANAAALPSIDLTLPMYVVATVVSDSGVGANTTSTEYLYKGLKVDTQGRGLLGFREVFSQGPGSNGDPLTTDTQYLQANPYIGAPANRATYNSALNVTSPATKLSATAYVYCDQTAAAGSDTTALSSKVNCPVTSKIQRPYLLLSTSTGQDLTGTALPTVTTQLAVNATGDPTQIVATTTGGAAGISQTFIKTTTNQYQVDDTSCGSDNVTCKWFLGRVAQSTVNSSVPNSLASIATSAGSSANAAAISGSGPIEFASLSSSLAFGNQNPGSSTTLSAYLSNNSAGPVTVTVPTATSVSGADFSFASTTCSTSLAPASSCTVQVTFTPTAAATRGGTLTVNTGSGALTTSLTGTGIGSAATLVSAALQNMPATWYGAGAQSLTVTYRNDGNAPMTLNTPSLAAPLSVTSNTCANTAAGNTCSMAVTAATNVPGLNQSQSFTPAGANYAPAAATIGWTTYSAVPRWSAGSLNFGNVTVGNASAQNITLYNDGNVAYNWASNNGIANAPAGYGFNTGACSNVAAGGGSCNVVVTFTPPASGPYSGSGISMSAASYNASTFSVTGTGLTPPSISASTGSISATSVSPTVASGTLSLTNNGQTPTTLTLSITGGNSLSAATLNCPGSGSCGTVTVTSPTGMGSYPGTLSMTSSSGGSVTSVGVSFTVTGSIATLTNAASLAFPSTTAGAAAPTVFWSIQNTGNANMTLTASALNSPFSWTNNTCTNIAPNSLCGMYAQMATSTVGSFSQGGITISGAAQGNRSDLSLSGSVGPGTTTLSANPTSLAFGTVSKGIYSAAKSLILTNNGSITANLLTPTYSYSSGSSSQGDYTSGGTCGSTLAAGASCTVTVTFGAGCTGGSRNATLTLPGSNFTALSIGLTATTSSSGVCP